MIPTREEKMDAALEEMRSALAEKDAALERCIQDLRETKEREMSLHVEILAARIVIADLEQDAKEADEEITVETQDPITGDPCDCSIRYAGEIKRLKGEVDLLKQFVLKMSKQAPETPDYWSRCGQCERNISEAEDLVGDQRR